MKYSLLSLFSFVSVIGYGQLTIDSARIVTQKYRLGSYSYHEEFIGHKGYGAPIIVTNDGGAAIFGGDEDSLGSCARLVKVDKKGNEMWKAVVRPQFTELESQSVVEDKNGNLYVFMLSYDAKRYRGGSQRVICYDKKGKILWDKTLGKYIVENNPTISYIHLLSNGKIELRGHIVKTAPAGDKDPVYNYWEGWLDSKGVLTQKTGDVIVWENQDWQKRLKPE